MTASSRSALAASANDEWSLLVSAAIVGTDRRSAQAPAVSWQAWAGSAEPAVALLDRALAVVAARRAGVRAAPVPSGHALEPVPLDPRPPCAPACAARLRRLLAGKHDVLLMEWFDEFTRRGERLPAALVPQLLLRGRRDAHLDAVVRATCGVLAPWLAAAVPELGVSPMPVAASSSIPGDQRVEVTEADVADLRRQFVDGRANWAAAAQLRRVVLHMPPAGLPRLIAQLSALPFDVRVERTKADVLALAEFRAAMLHELRGISRSAPVISPLEAPA